MHMADALLSPAVGGALWAATAATVTHSARKVQQRGDDRSVPLMGVVGAFVFAAQMVNFAIPGTGSSGHLGGGLLLAVLLGPHAAFLTIASVLAVQALFFADGGLLALGANVFNLGFFPCFLAYPLVYRPLAGRSPSTGRITAAAVAAAVLGLQLGALGVVLETVLSGVSALPFAQFALLMQPIHLAIGVVEGLVTAAVVSFVWRSDPSILFDAVDGEPDGRRRRKTLVALGAAALITGVGLSWFASAAPDGLEWSIARVTGAEELEEPDAAAHGWLARLQEHLSFLPGYGFRDPAPQPAAESTARWPQADPGTSLSGLLGGVLTLLLAVGAGWALRKRKPAPWSVCPGAPPDPGTPSPQRGGRCRPPPGDSGRAPRPRNAPRAPPPPPQPRPPVGR